MSPTTTAPIALVTGAARRIGAAIARALHADGYQLALHYQTSVGEATALAAEFNQARPDSAAIFQADIRAVAACEALPARVAGHFSAPVSLLVNNASSYTPAALGQTSAALFDDLIATNARAPLLLSKAALAGGGLQQIINLLDTHSRSQPRAGFAAYTAAKDALWALTEVLAVELAPTVRVNGVALGHIAAEVRAQPSAAELTDLTDKALQIPRVPLGRAGSADEVAAAVAWLAGANSRYLTGSILTLDGGRRLA
jgi:pteridine reductase